jgi:hypothetical protein
MLMNADGMAQGFHVPSTFSLGTAFENVPV